MHRTAPVESFFSLLKRERIRRQTYPTREDAKTDVFDYIERFYNRWRCHAYLGYIRSGSEKLNSVLSGLSVLN